MDGIVWSEWLNLGLRWFHILAGISWIGSSFYFMWLDKALEPPPKKDENVSGFLWMVHSGGFYRVEKRHLAAGQVPARLHWFKYEALFTWISGFSLLVLVYYWGEMMVDAESTSLTNAQASRIGMGSLVACWFLYDFFWNSPLAKVTWVGALISYLALVGIAYGLTHLFQGRAAYLHVAAILGTCMVANVWVRILPAQRQMIAATQAGKPRNQDLANRAKQRSVHNNYMTFPVVFLMVSHHFPGTYGSEYNWLVLAVLILASAGVRHLMNVYGH